MATKRKPRQDQGGKLCAKCTDGHSQDCCQDTNGKLDGNPGLITSTLPTETKVTKSVAIPVNMLPISKEQAAKIYEGLGLDPNEWSFGYELKYQSQKWSFYFLIKNLKDKTKNIRIHCGDF